MRNQIVLVIFAMIMAMHPRVYGQELYVYADPASNVPARSLSLKFGTKLMNEALVGNRFLMSRQMAEASIGLNKKWMIRPGFTFSDMFTNRVIKWESVRLYSKFRRRFKWRWICNVSLGNSRLYCCHAAKYNGYKRGF